MSRWRILSRGGDTIWLSLKRMTLTVWWEETVRNKNRGGEPSGGDGHGQRWEVSGSQTRMGRGERCSGSEDTLKGEQIGFANWYFCLSSVFYGRIKRRMDLLIFNKLPLVELFLNPLFRMGMGECNSRCPPHPPLLTNWPNTCSLQASISQLVLLCPISFPKTETMCVCVYVYIYIHIYIYTHTHTHTYIL